MNSQQEHRRRGPKPKLCEVLTEQIPRAFYECAHRRTDAIIDHWARFDNKARSLNILAASCYLQGINDMIQMMIQNGVCPEQFGIQREPIDFQI